MSRKTERHVDHTLRESKTATIVRRGGALKPVPDLVGYVNGRRVEADVVAAEPKTCLGCGARQQPDGSLPCGH